MHLFHACEELQGLKEKLVSRLPGGQSLDCGMAYICWNQLDDLQFQLPAQTFQEGVFDESLP